MASLVPNGSDDNLSVSNTKTKGNTTHYDIDEHVSLDLKKLQETAKARMDAKMRAKLKLREEKRAAKKAERERHTDPNESVPVFWQKFNSKEERVYKFMDEKLKLKSSSTFNGDLNKLLLDFDQVYDKIDEIQEMLAAAAFFLPGYDRRISQEKISEMRNRSKAVKEQLQPRKKFSFKSRRAAKKKKDKEKKKGNGAAGTENGKNESNVINTGSSSTANTGSKDTAAIGSTEEAQYPEIDRSAFDLCIENKSNETIIVEPGQLKDGGDIVLYNLTDCIVVIRDTMSALRVDKLNRCHVYGGPIAGSLLLHYCNDTKFWLASRQFRLHNSVNCVFYLHALSHPIIEDCTKLYFAPYLLDYPELEAQMQKSNLLRKSSMWKEVNDFKWLRIQQSPNWSILNREEWEKESKSDIVTLLQEPREEITV